MGRQGHMSQGSTTDAVAAPSGQQGKEFQFVMPDYLEELIAEHQDPLPAAAINALYAADTEQKSSPPAATCPRTYRGEKAEAPEGQARLLTAPPASAHEASCTSQASSWRRGRGGDNRGAAAGAGAVNGAAATGAGAVTLCASSNGGGAVCSQSTPVVELMPRRHASDQYMHRKPYFIPTSQVRPASACYAWENVSVDGQPAALRPELTPMICLETLVKQESSPTQLLQQLKGAAKRRPPLMRLQTTPTPCRQTEAVMGPLRGARAATPRAPRKPVVAEPPVSETVPVGGWLSGFGGGMNASAPSVLAGKSPPLIISDRSSQWAEGRVPCWFGSKTPSPEATSWAQALAQAPSLQGESRPGSRSRLASRRAREFGGSFSQVPSRR
mmetsp:Transcript_43642/g.120786  ORF Transcript_43642/g.120786 Transcript_43642/m.120786 type:complete len:385 (-) Transcript_43642:17-1171(-)